MRNLYRYIVVLGFVLSLILLWPTALSSHATIVKKVPTTTPTTVVTTTTTTVVHSHIHTVKTKSVGLQRWNTITYDPLATWPDATDPTWKLSVVGQERLACVRYYESRNHSFSVERHSDAEGWYQFMSHEWQYARQHLKGLPKTPLEATRDQQSEVAVWYYLRNGGLYPEWGDGC